jgi:hypothetical protein
MIWTTIAKDIPLGNKVRIKCPADCGEGETFSINHAVKNYWGNCYRCGYSPVEFKGQQTLAELKRIRELNDEAAEMVLQIKLPQDFTNEIPRHARIWLFKGGITEETWRKYGIGYSERLDRVVLPVYDTKGNLEWYQCRALHEGQIPKYLQPSRDRSCIMFHAKPETATNNRRAIVVEDILSAIRVGKNINTYSLLGTKITTEQASVLSKYDNVTTWMDPDKAGKDGAYKIRKTLGLVTDVSNILTSVDPKKLSNKEIIKCLNQQ